MPAEKKIHFRLIGRSDLQTLRGWFEDREIAHRISYPTDEWFEYVSSRGAAKCWLALMDDEVIAEIQVDREGAYTGYIDLALQPDLRGKGLGVAVLKAFICGPGTAYQTLDGRIAPDNKANLAYARRCGFTLASAADAEGFIQALYQREKMQSS